MVLNHRSARGKEHALVSVLPANQVGRPASRTVNLHDHPVPGLVPLAAPLHRQPIASFGLHTLTPFYQRLWDQAAPGCRPQNSQRSLLRVGCPPFIQALPG